ncbi:Hypothetical predicted protein [Lynx pardinus]|uniref:Uncharacterized protein n=1 Tax=Lynx pardinus TaxID=191816 RepID=A0A485NIP5_LYNPA|nr:Hypothetical predicted protein [Lynx pardinus]
MPKAWEKKVFFGPRQVFWASDFTWGYGTTMGGSWHLSQKHVPDLAEVLLGEHKAHIHPDMRQRFLQSWLFSRCPQMTSYIMGIMPQQHHSVPMQTHAGLLRLPGTHVVCSHNEG